MATQKKTYTVPTSGKPLISTISTGCETPWLEVKFCNLVHPFRYPNSPMIPRYSITCAVDPEIHGDFLAGIQCIENDEKVETIIKNETRKENGKAVLTGKLLVKFQNKEKIPLYLADEDMENSTEILDIDEELKKGSKIKIFYDILRYTKKNTMNIEHGLSFKPTKIYYDEKGEFLN